MQESLLCVPPSPKFSHIIEFFRLVSIFINSMTVVVYVWLMVHFTKLLSDLQMLVCGMCHCSVAGILKHVVHSTSPGAHAH